MRVILFAPNGDVKQTDISEWKQAKDFEEQGFKVVSIDGPNPVQFVTNNWYGINSFVDPITLS